MKIHNTRDEKLKWLQMRILRRLIATNIVLKEMKVVNDTKCKFCTNERDSIQHVFWKCDYIIRFWTIYWKVH